MERVTIALICALLLSRGYSQSLGDTLVMDFDDAATLVLDSVYPPGCWQVGAPDKMLFTSALSLPRALVTDTVLHPPANTTCYAEFTLLANEEEWSNGRWFEFDHWLDLAPGSHAWMEARDSWMVDWARLTDGWFLQGTVNYTNEGPEFAPSTGGWEHVVFDSPCIGVMDGGNDRWYDPLMRIRFVLVTGDDTQGHDGWMIDDFRATATLCSGGIDEGNRPLLRMEPNPASDRATVHVEQVDASAAIVVFRADGTTVGRYRVQGRNTSIDVSTLPSGPYLVRVDGSLERPAVLMVAN